MSDETINIIKYFLIGNRKTRKKIYELINTDDKQTYVNAQEIFYIYLNKEKDYIGNSKFKINSKGNTFHIFITKDNLIFISYTNQNDISTEQIFELFQNVKEYLFENIDQSRLEDRQIYLVEKENLIIKETIKNYLIKILDIKTIDIDVGQMKEEKYKQKLNFVEEDYLKPTENAQNECEKNNDNIVNNKRIKNDINLKSKDKNSIDAMIINKKEKTSSYEEKFKEKSEEKLKKFDINSNQNNFKNYSINYGIYHNYKDYPRVECNCCSKGFILFILALVIAVQIAMVPLIIHFCDFSL